MSPASKDWLKSILCSDFQVLTKWFEPENHFNPDIEMIVYDLVEYKFTTDGKTWHDIEADHL